MKESIYTIPISEVFEPKQGCPLCTLHRQLETRWVQYITGAAMMEPDVRLRTNEQGFCARHIAAMLEQRNRLSVALLLQTRLAHLLEELESPAGAVRGKKQRQAPGDCFVCGRIEGELARLADNLVVVWRREQSFRTLYAQQQHLCVPHYRLLAQAAGALRGKDRAQFLQQTAELVRQGLLPAKENIDAFCRLFDYHSSGAQRPPEEVATAVERAAQRLCGDDALPGTEDSNV